MKRLPSKPSALLLAALADLETVENDDRYKVNMLYWHMPNGKCSVCLAGSVMARSLRAPLDADLVPCDFGQNTNKLRALDSLRSGDIRWAYGMLNEYEAAPVELVDYSDGNDTPCYHDSREDWWLHMRSIVGILQAEGL